MTDDNNPRFRPSDLFGSEPSSSVPATDPLAELARLIGRTDPFAEHLRAARDDAPLEDSLRYEEPRDPRDDSAPRYSRGFEGDNGDWPAQPAPRAYNDSYV